MSKNKKIIIIVLSLFLLTGCTKYLKGDDKKTIVNKETGQSLTENILCQPTNENAIKLYKENKKDITNRWRLWRTLDFNICKTTSLGNNPNR